MQHSLTPHERQAAEHAYYGRPPDARWSTAARQIYRGIWQAKHGDRPLPAPEPATRDPRPTAHFSEATPFIHKPLQAWHLIYDDGEHWLLLFPHHADTEFVLHVAREVAGARRFTMQPIQYGHFHVEWPTDATVQQLYNYDIRVMDQDGMLRVPPRLPRRPPASQQ